MIFPVGPRMLVKPRQQEDIQMGSIILPGVTNANLFTAEIIRVSLDECPIDKDGNPICKVGDIVVYPQGSGTGHREGVEIFLWLQFGEIWGIDVPDAEKGKSKI